MKTYYDVLKIKKNSSLKEIKDAFIRLSKTYHPDVNKSSNAKENFVKINEAYSVLGKPDTRRKYDASISYYESRVHSSNQYRRQEDLNYAKQYYYYSGRRENYSQFSSSNNTISKNLVFMFGLTCILFGLGAAIQSNLNRKKQYIRSMVLATILADSQEKLRKLGPVKFREMQKAGTLQVLTWAEAEKEVQERVRKNKQKNVD